MSSVRSGAGENEPFPYFTPRVRIPVPTASSAKNGACERALETVRAAVAAAIAAGSPAAGPEGAGVESRVTAALWAGFDVLVSAVAADPARAMRHTLPSPVPALAGSTLPQGEGAACAKGVVVVRTELRAPQPALPLRAVLVLTVMYLMLGQYLANHLLSQLVSATRLRNITAFALVLASVPWVVYGRAPDAMQATVAGAVAGFVALLAWADFI